MESVVPVAAAVAVGGETGNTIIHNDKYIDVEAVLLAIALVGEHVYNTYQID
jgi:hypothetical protein